MSDGDIPSGSLGTPEVLTPGEKFGDYQVMQSLAVGFLGGLYRIQHIFDGTETCVTVLPKEVGDLPEFSSRFREHANALKELKHPNIQGVTDFGRIRDSFCLYMELIEGQNLNDYLEEYTRKSQAESGVAAIAAAAEEEEGRGPRAESTMAEQAFGLPQVQVKEILRQTAEALQAGQEAGVMHFNLNPTNVIRSPDGSIKVTGFGLMDMLGPEFLEQLMALPVTPIKIGTRQIVINTLDTLSPEVRQGIPGDVRSDPLCFRNAGLLPPHWA